MPFVLILLDSMVVHQDRESVTDVSGFKENEIQTSVFSDKGHAAESWRLELGLGLGLELELGLGIELERVRVRITFRDRRT